MYDSTLQSDPPPSLQRARGHARMETIVRGRRNALSDLYQSGCAKIKFPRVYDHSGLEAVLINTAGGLTGGDVLETDIRVGIGGFSRITGQACERIYRRRDGVARIDSKLTVEAGASLHWLPQETILFDRSALIRNLTIDLAADAKLIALESTIFGRAAMGETAIEALFRESWRVRLDGRLLFAEEAGVEGDVRTVLSGAPVTAGATCTATLLCIDTGLEEMRDTLRESVADRMGLTWGCSLRMGALVCRAVSQDSAVLRLWIHDVYHGLTGGLALPRPWYC